VNQPEHPPKTQSPRTGIFASLCAHLHLKGSTAPTHRRASIALSAALALTALALTAAPALAAPEAPKAEPPTEVKATTASLNGVLAPKAPGEAGSFYKFIYKASKAKVCTGGSETTPAGISLGAEDEVLPAEPVTGLTANTEYAVCLVAENAAQTERTTSTAISFKTAFPPEKPVTLSPAKEIKGTSAKLEGTLNPVKAGEAGTYEFVYQQSATECAAGALAPAPPGGTMTGAAKQAVSETVTGLEPLREYTFCLVAINKAGESASGVLVHFKTLAAPPAVEHESVALPVKATEAHLEGIVNPDNQLSECHFQYGEALVSEHTLPCEPELLKGFGGQGIGANVTGLSANTTYHFQIVTKNGAGEENVPTEETFETALPPETPEAVKAEPIAPTEATLLGALNPGLERTKEPGSYEFRYRQSATECQGGAPGEEKATPATPAPGLEKDAPAGAPVTELLPGTQYTFCLLAANEAGETSAASLPVTFTTLAVAPTLSAEEATHLTATTATLQAEINPHGAQVTTCQFEYGTESGVYPHALACAPSPGSGTAAVPVSAQAEPLEANKQYHWRLTATNAAGTTTSPDHTFIYSTTAAELPDHRAYEMVTPPFKNGGLVGDVFVGAPPAISEGEGPESLHQGPSRVLALDIQCFVPAESCNGARQINGEPFAFTRTGAGWVTTALAPPAQQFAQNTPWRFSANEGTALFSMPTGPAQEDEWYARSPGGSFSAIGPAAPPGVTGIAPFQTSIITATADLSHVIWRDLGPAAGGVLWPFDKTTGPTSLYEYSGAHNPEPFLVGVSNKGRPEGNTESKLISNCETSLGLSNAEAPWNAVSADGRTVYFTASGHDFPPPGCTSSVTAPPVYELYARVDGEGPEARTVAISQPDAPETLASAPPDENCTEAACVKNTEALVPPAVNPSWSDARFWGASEDGSKVFFTDTQQLTNEATQGSGTSFEGGCEAGGTDCNLYLYDKGATPGHNLIDVSAGSSTPEVQGVMATSADGSHVYFVAKGKLAANRSVLGSEAVEGADNLYVFDTGTRHTAFIASLPGSDGREWQTMEHHANVTPDGRFLVFASHGDLTPGDTSGAGYTQIFRYDAASEQLVRISIGEGGFGDNGNAGVGQDTIVPPVATEADAGPPRGDPTMSNDGSYVFFQSPRALTPHALSDVVVGHKVLVENGVVIYDLTEYAQNVYEFHEGHVYLISDGRDASNTVTPCQARIEEPASNVEKFGSAVCLLGTDATGHNVFFMTADQLVPSDTDTQVDTYDARICEPENGNPCIQPAPSSTPPCLGEQCHGIPPERSSLLTGGSATLNGPGNLTPPPPGSALQGAVAKPKTAAQIRAEKLTRALKSCKKDRKKSKRKSCEKQAHKKYGAAKKAKKSTHRKGSH